MFAWLKRKEKQEQIKEPKKEHEIAKGQIWYFSDKNDPWGCADSKVTILDVKDGWVRYYMNPVFNDNRRPIESFVSMYSRVDY